VYREAATPEEVEDDQEDQQKIEDDGSKDG
jgi:hypothetical protein